MNAIRHEQAVLVVMAYVVGFVTAFIAFGVNKSDEAKQIVYTPTTNEVQANQVIEATEEESMAPVNNSANNASVAGAFYQDGMFTAVNNSEQVVLSVDSALMPDLATDPQFASQGLHQSPPEYVVSPNGAFIYFCEEYTTPGTCRSFVYDLAQDLIIPVTFAGERTEISLSDAATASWSNNTLLIADFATSGVNGTWDMTIN